MVSLKCPCPERWSGRHLSSLLPSGRWWWESQHSKIQAVFWLVSALPYCFLSIFIINFGSNYSCLQMAQEPQMGKCHVLGLFLQKWKKGKKWVIKWIIQKKSASGIRIFLASFYLNPSEKCQKLVHLITVPTTLCWIQSYIFFFDKIVNRYVSFPIGRTQLYFKHLSRSDLGRMWYRWSS